MILADPTLVVRREPAVREVDFADAERLAGGAGSSRFPERLPMPVSGRLLNSAGGGGTNESESQPVVERKPINASRTRPVRRVQPRCVTVVFNGILPNVPETYDVALILLAMP
jgi:hypothetical protein